MLQRTSALTKARRGIVNLQVKDKPMQTLVIGELVIQSTYGDATAPEVESALWEENRQQ
jgi:hypothetical protein